MNTQQIQDSSRSEAIRIVAVYALFGSLWILSSDSLLGWLLPDPTLITRFSMFKGLLAIALTAVLLYVLIRRYVKRLVERTIEIDQAHLELARQKALLENVIEGTSDAVYVKDPLGRYVLVNSALAGFLGKPVNEIVGKDDTDLFAPDDAQAIMATDHRIMALVGPQSIEEHLTTSRGEGFFLSTKGTIRSENGNVTGLFGIARDITERKRMEETLLFLLQNCSSRSGEDFFELLARHLSACLKMEYVCIDRLEENGLEARTLAVFHDGQFEDNLQYALKDTPCGEVVGKTICVFESNVAQLFPQDAVLQELQAESYAGTTLWSFDGQPIGLIAVIGRQPLANPGLVESILRLVALRAAGELERRQVEKELRLSEERYRLLTSITSDFVYSCLRCGTDEFQIKWMSGAVETLTGYSIDEFYKMGCLLSIVHPDDYEHTKVFIDGPTPGKKHTVKFRIITKTGDVRWIQETSCCKQGDTADEVLRYGSSQDITEQEQLRDQLVINEKLESLGLLAGGIAHNFNNILTGIVGNISFAQMFIDPAHKSYKPLLEAEKASMRAGELARQLLTFGGGGEPIRKTVSTGMLFDEIAALLPRDSNVRLSLDIPDSINAIQVDRGQIEQVFNNIVLNAAQAMPDGGALTITARNEALDDANCLSLPDGPYVRISFTDQGCGITDENLKRIFTPYFSTKLSGNGLGLALAHSIIEKHGGHISASSVVGKGTIFTVYLPAVTTCVTMPEAAMAAYIADGHAAGSVLVMDDEEMIRELASEMLIYLGYQVVSCGDGREAVKRYAAALQSGTPFVAVIMDLTIPGGMGGKEAAEQILAMDPNAFLVVSSGYSNDPIMANYRVYGFSSVVAKPYKINELEQALHSLPLSEKSSDHTADH